MAGFASIIDALGGVTVDVGPEPLPIGGVTPDGRHVSPTATCPPASSTSTATRRSGSPAPGATPTTTTAWAASAACSARARSRRARRTS